MTNTAHSTRRGTTGNDPLPAFDERHRDGLALAVADEFHLDLVPRRVALHRLAVRIIASLLECIDSL